MMKRIKTLLFILLLWSGHAVSQIPAFPGAEGFGAYAVGGRGGDVYVVTSLDNNGAGTLRDALNTAPPEGRTIVFAVSGYIPVNSDTNFQVPANVTIAGQTAPGDGVGLKGGRMLIIGNNTIMRHFRIRHGKYGTGGDCLNIADGVDTTMLDHIDMMFSTDENFSFFGGYPDDFTMQYSATTWGMERHNAGGLWDLEDGSCHHSLWAHHRTRNPKARPGGLLEWVNNVTFHWRNEAFIMGDSETPADWKANVEGCYYISIDDADDGSTLKSTAFTKAHVSSDGVPNFSLYLADTLFDNNENGLVDGTDRGYDIVDGTEFTAGDPVGSDHYYVASTPFPGAPEAITVDDPLTAYKKVVSSVGPLRLDAAAASLRDELDSLLIDTVTNQYSILVQKDGWVEGEDPLRTSNGEQLLADQYGVSNNGFGTLNNGVARPDSDLDGMPDDWELALGSGVGTQDHNTVFANDGSVITAATFFPSNTVAGYTALEEYLHFCAVPHAWTTRNTAQQPSSVSVDLSRYTCGFSNAPVFTLSGVVGGSVQQTGSVVEFTPTQDTYGRAGFYFNVTDADGSSWTQQFCILVTVSATPRDLTWTGSNGTAWDSTTFNWSSDTQASTPFSIGDSARFDNTGATTAVALSSNVIAQSVTVTGSQSYSFAGPGALTIVDGFTNASSGSVTLSTPVSAGDGALLSGGETVISSGGSLTGGEIELSGGATLTDSTGASGLTLSSAMRVGSGQTGTVNLSSAADVNGAISGGGTLNLGVNSAGDYFVSDCSGFTGQFNVSALTGTDEFKINLGYDSGLQLANGKLHLGSGVVMHQTMNGPSGDTGTPHNIGELSGDAGSEIGGQPIGGRYADWIVGALNTDSTFAGIIRDSNYQDAWGGYGASKLSKVGTGTLTLSGNCAYSGITAIWDGELNVTGSLGSDTDVYVGNGATLSGSGTMGRLLTLQTGGEIEVGDAPGAVGTMTTAGGVTLNAGTLVFDLSSNPASGNDQIVNTAGTLTFDGSDGSAYFEFNLIDGSLSEGAYDLIVGGTNTAAPGSPVFTHNLVDTADQAYALQRSGGGSSDTYVRLVVTDLAPEPPSAPTGLAAEPGNTTVMLTWNPMPGATGYVIKRAGVSEGPYAEVGTTASSSFTDSGLVNLTAYYYVVSATNAYGESADSGEVSVMPEAGNLKINGGGPAVSSFEADSYVSGGSSWSRTEAIDTSAVFDPAPESVYQTEHNGDFSYTFPGLVPEKSYLVRLHFAEIYHTAAGSRVFNVAINGATVLENYDVYADAGARYKAVVREFTVPADGSGQISLSFATITDNAKVSAIEIRTMDDPEMLAYYAMDGDVADSSSNGSDGSAAGAPAYTTGHSGQAIDLDGSDDVITLPAGLVDARDLSIAAWVYWDGGDNWQRIFDFGNGTGEYLFLTPRSYEGTLRFAITHGGDEQVVETSALATGQWTHLAVTLRGDVGTLYVNGVAVDTNLAMKINPSDFNPAVNCIAKSQYASDPLFDGRVDEVKIFNYALSDADVANIALDLDADLDGLDDGWELAAFGDLAQSPTDDPDGDGDDNATEAANGTDPAVSSIPPEISLALTEEGVSLSWSENHIGWVLYYCTNLVEGSWRSVRGSNRTNAVDDDVSSDGMYYRMEYSP